MPIVKVSRGASFQVEIPDSVAERSCKGSLHFTPSSVREVTEGELAHIRAKRPDVAQRLEVVTPAAPAPAPAPEAKQEPPAEPEAVPADGPAAKPVKPRPSR